MQKLITYLNTISRRKILLIIASITFLVYFNHLGNGFVWDDEEQIVNNTTIHSLSNLSYIFTGATFNTGGAGLSGWFFRPFITLWFMLNYALFSGSATGFHLTQLALHIMVACLLFSFLEKIFPRSPYQRSLNFLLTLFFAVHPGINEAVVYISAVSEVALTFTSLLGILILLRGNENRFFYAGLVMFSGFLFKESGLTVLPILPFLGYLYDKKNWKKYLTFSISLFSIYLFLRLVVVRTPIRHPAFSPISEASFISRILTIPQEVVDYLRLYLFPLRLGVSQHYVSDPTRPNFFVYLGLFVIFILLLVFYIYKRRSKQSILAFIWLISTFSIISNIIPLDMTIAERWFYLPIIGFIILTSDMLFKLPKKISLSILLTLIPIFSIRTMIRNTNWRDGLSLYSHDINSSKDSFDLENNLGVELYRVGRIDEAKTHFERSIELQPKWHFAYNNLGAYYLETGDYDQAIDLFNKTLETSDYFRAHLNLVTALYLKGEVKQAISQAENSILKLPANPELWRMLAIMYKQEGDLTKSLQAATYSFSLLPTSATYSLLENIRQEVATSSANY